MEDRDLGGAPIKILFINETYKTNGGASIYLANLSMILRAKGHDVYLFAIDKDMCAKEKSKFIYRDRYKRGILKYVLYYYLDPFLGIGLYRFIESIKPDIIHLNANGAFTSTILLTISRFKVPIVQTLHDYSLICRTSFLLTPSNMTCCGCSGLFCVKQGCISWIKFLYESVPLYINKVLVKSVDQFLCPSMLLMKTLKNKGIKNVIYAPNFVDIELFNNSFLEECDDFLYVGRLSKEKGVHILIQSIKLIVDAKQQCKLHIIGEGPAKTDLIKLVKNLDIERYIYFHDWMNPEEISAFYRRTNALIIPSTCIENSPLVAYEAMASGRPIIGSNIGGIPELIEDGTTGFLVEPGNPEQIADRIIRLKSDKDLAVLMGERAREICVSKYSNETYYYRLMKVYIDLIENKT